MAEKCFSFIPEASIPKKLSFMTEINSDISCHDLKYSVMLKGYDTLEISIALVKKYFMGQI